MLVFTRSRGCLDVALGAGWFKALQLKAACLNSEMVTLAETFLSLVLTQALRHWTSPRIRQHLCMKDRDIGLAYVVDLPEDHQSCPCRSFRLENETEICLLGAFVFQNAWTNARITSDI